LRLQLLAVSQLGKWHTRLCHQAA